MSCTTTPPQPTAGSALPKVLIVDDKEFNLFALSKVLASEPVEVVTAPSGEAALSRLLRDEFALILLDVRMPGMDGFETATLMREHTVDKPVPIVFLTAGDQDEQSRARGYDSGAIDFLFKPVDEAQLRTKVRMFVELYEHRRKLDEATRALRHSHDRITQILHAVAEGILGIGQDGRISFANAAACRLLATRQEQLVGEMAEAVIGLDLAPGMSKARSQGVFRCDEATFAGASARRIPVSYSLAPLAEADEGGSAYVLAFQDITHQQAVAERLRHDATCDHLTGLANRLAFEQQLEQRIQQAWKTDTPFALLFLDLDGFKPVNDQCGHLLGDELLRAVAGRLRHSVRGADFCARLGGDEFAVLLGQVQSVVTAMQTARQLHEALCLPYDCADTSLSVGASIGVAMFGPHGKNARDLIAASDAAMYRAKRDPAASVVLAEPLNKEAAA